MVAFKDIEVGDFFEFEFSIWQKQPQDNLWNAKSGERWGQFEEDEQVLGCSKKETKQK